MCSILPLIAARLLLLAVQWKWSLAKSNNFQVILGKFSNFKIFKLIQQVFHFRQSATRVVKNTSSRAISTSTSPKQVFPTSNRFLLNEELIVHQSLARAVLDGLTSKADVVNFCQLLSLLSMWRQRRQPVRLTPQSSEHQCAIFQIKYLSLFKLGLSFAYVPARNPSKCVLFIVLELLHLERALFDDTCYKSHRGPDQITLNLFPAVVELCFDPPWLIDTIFSRMIKDWTYASQIKDNTAFYIKIILQPY